MRHFCQLVRNWALASSMLAARPLVMMPSFGLTYTVIDQNHRRSACCAEPRNPPHLAAILDDNAGYFLLRL